MPSSLSNADEPSAPLLVLEPRRGASVIAWGELWRYRELLYFLAWRDIKVRYKQTVLGAAWAVLQPVTTMIVFTVFFGRLGGLDRNVTIAYPVFVYAGLLPWTFFASAVSQSANSLVGNSGLIAKVYFPRLLIPCSSVATSTIDLLISSAVMAALMIWYGVVPSVWLVLLPVLFVLLWCAALGIGAWMAALLVAYRDLRHVLTFLLQIWMFASPVAYPLDIVPEQWRLAYSINPMAGLIHGFRVALLDEPLEVGCLALSSISALAVFWIGIAYFARAERRFADIV
ncbi:MAG TPA: ABC transporter permease [Pirellulales bacterium]|jgi:lipopolysaccharide transport system permease protein|nr:ABC transporter permease [Pirellulales bacterium]